MQRNGVVDVNIRYEPLQDILVMTFQSDVPIADVRENVGGTICCYDDSGDLVALEIVDASRNLDKIRIIERRLNEFVDGCTRRGRG